MKKLVLLSLVALMISCKNKPSEEKSSALNEEKTESPKEVILTPKQVFLKENGINMKIDLPDDQFAILQKAVETGIFKDKSFCEFYEEYKSLEFANKYKESDKVISSFKKVDQLESLLAVRGHEFCPEEIARVKTGRSVKKSTYYSAKTNPCDIAKDFIRKDLQHPSTAGFSSFDCSSEENSDKSYTVLRKVSAKNAFNLELNFIYKLRFGYIGGNESDLKSWKLIGITSEEVGK